MDLAINSMAMTMQDHHGGLISPLDVAENGTYVADGLTVDGYSPVNVNTEDIVGEEPPIASAGNDGDYYYQRRSTRNGIKRNSSDMRTSGNYHLGFEFSVNEPLIIKGFRANFQTANITYDFTFGTLTNVLFQTSTAISESPGWNTLMLDVPISLSINTNYILIVNMSDTKGYWDDVSNMRLVKSSKINLLYGRDGDMNSSSTYPHTRRTSDCYFVDIIYEVEDAEVIKQYRKKNGIWTEIVDE